MPKTTESTELKRPTEKTLITTISSQNIDLNSIKKTKKDLELTRWINNHLPDVKLTDLGITIEDLNEFNSEIAKYPQLKQYIPVTNAVELNSLANNRYSEELVKARTVMSLIVQENSKVFNDWILWVGTLGQNVWRKYYNQFSGLYGKTWEFQSIISRLHQSVIQDLLRNNIPTQSIQTTLDSDLSNLQVYTN